jgi:hypothetical protein
MWGRQSKKRVNLRSFGGGESNPDCQIWMFDNPAWRCAAHYIRFLFREASSNTSCAAVELMERGTEVANVGDTVDGFS